MRKYTIYGVMLLLSSISLKLMADTKTYKIEVLVFAQNIPTSEIFDQYESQIEWPRLLAERSRYDRVAVEHMSLSGIKAKLQRSAGYHPLMHVAWTQTIKANRIGTAVHLYNQSDTVNGFFRIQRGHYLHMITDLEYHPNGSLIYRLTEKRRFKLNEIHYLDHPKFGVIVKVSPLISHEPK